MGRQAFSFENLERVIAEDRHFVFTLALFVAVLVVFLNQVLNLSVVVGAVASVFYFLVGVVFLGRAFFEDEVVLVRFLLGGLVLLVFLGLVGWVVMIVYSLDVWMSALVLCAVAACCSLLNRVRRSGKRGVA